MKKIFTLIIFLTIQYSFGQACGLYRIKYVGNIKSESLKIEKIKLPTIVFLHGLEDKNSENSFVEIEMINSQINTDLVSPLTSHLYDNAESLLKFYMTKKENIPIIIIATENGILKEIRRELSWDTIKITELEDDKFGNLFELNLNEIYIK